MAEYISISEYAKIRGVSVQTVYNYIKENRVTYITYKRGKTTGYLIKND